MKDHRRIALLLTGALCLGLLAGCGTSQPSDSASEHQVASSWAELTQTPTPQVVTPQLSQAPQAVEADKDVTADYISAFVGTWDSADSGKTYEFKSNENLVVTNADGSTTNYTFWFQDQGSQVWLYLYENGAEEAATYSFTQSGSNLTLYDTVSGSAAEQLTRRAEVTPTPAATATPTPTPTPTAAPTATPTPTAAPSPTPSAAPSPSPSAAPEPTPTVSMPPELPQNMKAAMPGVECALEVVADGTDFDPENSGYFWSVMARYLSRTHESGAEGTFTVGGAEVLTAANEVFGGVQVLPELPENSGYGDLIPGQGGAEDQYELRWGAFGGHDLEILSFDESGTLEMQVDGGDTYQVTLNAGGSIQSIEKQ